jgi:hypothetical protein
VTVSVTETNKMSQARTITMKVHQVAHFRRIRNILSSWFVALDNSDCGSGKTVVTTAVALSLGLSLVVVAPPGPVHHQWRETAKQYGVPLLVVTSYERLRMSSNSETALVRRLGSDELAAKGNDAPSAFEHTPFFSRLLDHGILLVFDEFHMLKTDRTLRMETAHCMVRALVHNPNTVSRVSLLSATPCDRFENAVSLLKMMGLLTHNTLLPHGVVEVAEIAKVIDPITFTALSAECGQIQQLSRMKPKRAAQFAYEVYRDIFGPWLRSSTTQAMSDVVSIEPRAAVDHLRFNGFYKFPPEDNIRLKKAYDAFSSSLATDETESSKHLRSQSLIEMEFAKVNTLVRLIRARLDDEVKHPHAKIIAYLNYRAPLDALSYALSSYAPLVLNGATSDKERLRGVVAFQKPTDEVRLIIAHPSVGGVGVNLDDTDGRFPRTQFACPSFMFIAMHQLTGRVARTSTMSNSETYIVFSDAVPEELRMIDNLSRKAKTMKDYKAGGFSGDTVETESPREITYPGEYPSHNEMSS